MELWIRSQDKTTLTKDIECIEITKNKNKYNIDIYYTTTIGTYKTKQRAFEVLDEIQDILIGADKIFIKDTKIKLDSEFVVIPNKKLEVESVTRNIIVYEMPKD